MMILMFLHVNKKQVANVAKDRKKPIYTEQTANEVGRNEGRRDNFGKQQ
jgi:hypothetical protein